MAIIKFKKREELKILFAIKLPMIISELYKEARNKREANEIIRNSLNMKKNRVINTLELVDGFGNQFSVLVIYDNIMEEKELLKYNLDVEEINFRILEFDFNNKIEVEEKFGDKVLYKEQKIGKEYPYGTGYAVQLAVDEIRDDDSVLILSGDTPLIKGETLQKLLEEHIAMNSKATVLTAFINDTTGYGHIIKDNNGKFLKIDD